MVVGKERHQVGADVVVANIFSQDDRNHVGFDLACLRRAVRHVKGVIGSRVGRPSDCRKLLAEWMSAFFEALCQRDRPAPRQTPRMRVQGRPRQIRNTDERVLETRLLEMLGDRGPDKAFGRFVGSAGFAPNTQHRAHTAHGGRLVAPEDDHRRGAVAGDVGTRGVDHRTQVDGRQELFDELGAELALHEGVGGDLADPARGPGTASLVSQVKEEFHERHRQRVLAVARSV